MTDKSFLQVVFEGLSGATVTLVKRLDCRRPHSSWYKYSRANCSQNREIAQCFVLLSVVYYDGMFKATPLEFRNPPKEVTSEIRYKTFQDRHEMYQY